MSNVNMIRYTLSDFALICRSTFTVPFTPQMVSTMNEMSRQIGGMGTATVPAQYVHTAPVQISSTLAAASAASSQSSLSRNNSHQHQQQQPAHRERDIVRSAPFHATKFAVSTGSKADVDKIRLAINKISDTTYENLSAQILASTQAYIDTYGSNEEDMVKLVTGTMEILSANKYYSRAYSNLFVRLWKTHECFHSTLSGLRESIVSGWTSLEFADSDRDYDKYCLLNKLHDKQRAVLQFYVNVAKGGETSISQTDIDNLFREFIVIFLGKLGESGNGAIVDELVEHLAILHGEVSAGAELNEVNALALCKAGKEPWLSLTNKTLFKLKDLVEGK